MRDGVRPNGVARASLSPVLGDFTATWNLIALSTLAICVGAVSAVLALVLLRLIGLFTNLFFFGRVNTELVSPAGNHLGPLVIAVPVIATLQIVLRELLRIRREQLALERETSGS